MKIKMPLFRRKTGKGSIQTQAKSIQSPNKQLGIDSTSNSMLPDLLNGDVGVAVGGVEETRWNPPPLLRLSCHPTLVKTDSNAESKLGDLGGQPTKETFSFKRTSKLSATIDELFESPLAVRFFVEYMKSHAGADFINFWLDAESFNATTRTRMQSVDVVGTNTLGENSSRRKKISSDIEEETAEIDTVIQERIHEENDVHDTPLSASGETQLSTNDGETSTDAREKLRKSIERDAMRIYSKYICPDAKLQLGLSDKLRNDIVAKICSETKEVDPGCFIDAQIFVKDLMKENFYPGFMKSSQYTKYQIDLLTGGKLELCDVLYNETALFYFMEFVEKENVMLLLEFWLAADNFQQNLAEKDGQYDSEEAQGDAMVLYDKYFSLQATCPLGFNDHVRFEVEGRICREGGPLPDCFQTPIAVVLNTLSAIFLPAFLRSELYFRYLSELINTMQAPSIIIGKTHSHKRTESEGSEHSVSSQHSGAASSSTQVVQNTLLAGCRETSSQQAAASTSSQSKVVRVGGHMQIDTEQFHPDSLWKRKPTTGLSLGKVDELGKFQTGFEPQPERKNKGSLLGKAVKKFVVNEDQKEKEDMAWRVAEMIIRDITSMTQPPDGDAVSVTGSDTSSIHTFDSSNDRPGSSGVKR